MESLKIQIFVNIVTYTHKTHLKNKIKLRMFIGITRNVTLIPSLHYNADIVKLSIDCQVGKPILGHFIKRKIY